MFHISITSLVQVHSVELVCICFYNGKLELKQCDSGMEKWKSCTEPGSYKLQNANILHLHLESHWSKAPTHICTGNPSNPNTAQFIHIPANYTMKKQRCHIHTLKTLKSCSSQSLSILQRKFSQKVKFSCCSKPAWITFFGGKQGIWRNSECLCCNFPWNEYSDHSPSSSKKPS